MAGQPGGRKFVVATADEGDPGAYIDRFLLEKDPDAILESDGVRCRVNGNPITVLYLIREIDGAAIRDNQVNLRIGHTGSFNHVLYRARQKELDCE